MGDLSLLIPILLYLVITLVIARVAAARQASNGGFTQRYFLGGQFMGGTLLALALVTTYTSASSFIGGPGAAYKFGLGWVLLAMVQVPVALLTLGVLGPKLWRLAKESGAVTILDVLEQRYRSPTLLWLAGISLLAAFVGMVVVQFTGGARLLSVMTGVDYRLALAIFVGTVLIYTLWGGFRAVSYTDALQGLVMIFGMIALFIGLLIKGGGMENLTTTLAAQDPGLLQPHGPDEFLSWPFLMSFWVLVCLGTLGLPHTVLRTMAVKDMGALRRAMILGTAVSSVVILLPHLSGVLGRALLPDLASPDEVMPTLMVTLFPPMVAGLLLAAPMAAVMSSVDSMLLQAGSTLVRDMVQRQRPLTEGAQKALSYSSTVGLTLLCGVLALDPPDMIVWLNLASLGALQVVFLWPLVLGLFWSRADARGAILSMLTGLALFLYWTTAGVKPLGLHAIVPSLALSGVVFVLFSLRRRA
ncbi:sodium/pantothenate symporter [Ferrimonas balearica]|uniref:sodium/pantothenate symporter n=1 Tax=Ferrimonas balearica TaxID=44012 RepID=UPI001C999E39|nr:sodium/pantothenate symporter [Ferrimonas balearica]MBY5922191.1 sodium/pantothenate symporter [Ferrimonas balearica]MBY5994469.1 sodium/pantothenate symporter [Ferrimonas balearica]